MYDKSKSLVDMTPAHRYRWMKETGFWTFWDQPIGLNHEFVRLIMLPVGDSFGYVSMAGALSLANVLATTSKERNV